jgi:hypothetical protein
MMRSRTRLLVSIACCAGLAACAAAPRQGPDVAVTAPSVGRPPPPSSAQAALSREAFTPYAALGVSNNDGLAPGESGFALGGACMTAAGYPQVGAAAVGFSFRMGSDALSFGQPWGGWGYLGQAEAEQEGFLAPPGSALSQLGIDLPPSPPPLPAAEQAAASRCVAILQDFGAATASGALAGIETLVNDLATDVQQDPAVRTATRSWAACMARNGFSFAAPESVFPREIHAIYGDQQTINVGDPVSAAARQQQTAVAVTDASCTQAADLAGIYFAVQASYEQQVVDLNQPALAAAVRRYRAAYRKELTRLPDLLRTTPPAPAPPSPASTSPAAAG